GLLFRDSLLVERVLARSDGRLALGEGLVLSYQRLVALIRGSNGLPDRARQAGDQCHDYSGGAAARRAGAPDGLAQGRACAGRTRQEGLVRQEPLEIGCELRGSRIATLAILLERAQRDPVEVARERARRDGSVCGTRARPRRLLVEQDALQLHGRGPRE